MVYLIYLVQKLHVKIDRQTLEELGYASCINDWDSFPGIDDMIIPYFEKDEEVSINQDR